MVVKMREKPLIREDFLSEQSAGPITEPERTPVFKGRLRPKGPRGSPGWATARGPGRGLVKDREWC